MSQGTFTFCNQCGKKSECQTDMFGGRDDVRWIHTSRSRSISDDIIGAGGLDFCDETCLVKYIQAKAKDK